MNQKKIVIISVIATLALFTGIVAWHGVLMPHNRYVTNYDECAAAGYPILDSYPEQCQAPGGKTYTRNINQDSDVTSITISGTTVCLPHKNMNDPHTMECATGIQTDDGTYYALGSDPYDVRLSEVGRKVQVTGMLKIDDTSKYNNKGTITVSSYKFLD